MGPPPAVPSPSVDTAPFLDGAFRLVVVLSAVLVALVGLSVLRGALAPAGNQELAVTAGAPGAFLYPEASAAPELRLVGQDGTSFSPARFSGVTTLVFFGYTHCADVCPATMGILTQAATAHGPGVDVIFVTVDPDRDTVPWLKEYVRYLPGGFSALTGTAAEVRTAANAWGVRYAKVETGTPGEYSMSHTAEVYLVDESGRLRAHFPFGTQADAILATVRLVAGSNLAAGAPSNTPTLFPSLPSSPPPTAEPATTGPLSVEVVSSSVWAGGPSPMIMVLSGPGGRLADMDARVSVQLATLAGAAQGEPVDAVAVRPPGEETVSYVAFLDAPEPGWWDMSVTALTGGAGLAGRGSISALEQGSSARLGGSAPAARSPTLDDVGGVALHITTDALPDLRLSRTSTADALAAHQAFVLVVDSARFKVTPACGKALALAKDLVDRWPTVPFIHLEPYRYDVVTDTAVLQGSLGSPTLADAAEAWGVGGAPWGVGSMPWAFVVDGQGTIVAKYQGVVGSGDIDVIVSLLADRG